MNYYIDECIDEHIFLNIPEDPVFGTRYYLCFFIFFSMVVPGAKYSQKKFGKFFGLKKGDLVSG
jgi:hypothetical protein